MMVNNLFLRRLVVYTNEGKVAYDESFHKGINIICGTNSSGKSTITHFIFFALGGEFNDFVPEARECQVVYAEIEANGTVLTIRRHIEINPKTGNINARIAMHFFWGDFAESQNPPTNKYWQKFEYNTTANKKSFSNVIFELLNLPEIREENNITIHQILRLLYIDQESPTSSLFYYEEFDKQAKREAVADLLLGIYNEDLYGYKQELYNSEKRLEDLKHEIRLTKRFFQDTFSLDKEHINSQIAFKEKEIEQYNKEILDIRNNVQEVKFESTSQLEFQQLQSEATIKRTALIELQNEVQALKNEIIDSDYFIDALNDKYRSLTNSVQTREYLGQIPIEYCPECLNRLVEVEGHNCKLCKQNSDDSFGVTQAKRMQLEIRFQIEESKKLLEFKNNKLKNLDVKLEVRYREVDDLQVRINNSIADVRPFELEKLDNLNYQKGLAEGEISQFRTMLEQANIYKRLIDEKAETEKNISTLNYRIETIKRNQSANRRAVMQQVQTEGVYLLNNDLERQREFTNAEAEDFIIDFSNNLVYLKTNNSEKLKQYQKFSASSNFYLKISARFALFLSSLKEEKMRFPRFIFADNMEDKGIEEKRAQNFQSILITRINELDPASNHQLIYTTSYISDELRDTELVVGEYYSKDNPTLKNIS